LFQHFFPLFLRGGSLISNNMWLGISAKNTIRTLCMSAKRSAERKTHKFFSHDS
jgi:hypothetical protein